MRETLQTGLSLPSVVIISHTHTLAGLSSCWAQAGTWLEPTLHRPPARARPGMETAGPSFSWRAANGGEIVLGLVGQTAAQLPRLTRRYDPFLGVRVGEAANLGPGASRRNLRARAMKAARAECGQADYFNPLVQALLPMILAALHGGGQEQGAAEAGNKKEKDKKSDIKVVPTGTGKAAVIRAQTAEHAAAFSAAKPVAVAPKDQESCVCRCSCFRLE